MLAQELGRELGQRAIGSETVTPSQLSEQSHAFCPSVVGPERMECRVHGGILELGKHPHESILTPRFREEETRSPLRMVPARVTRRFAAGRGPGLRLHSQDVAVLKVFEAQGLVLNCVGVI